ncbi:hypothetical protein KKF81_00550 [Candidatus Micrarchaeota archaeon]|nr:hypothetical protein [Candidatus Micrarchaeota archaeon]MBU1165408.1 hypothetical protein [Candidatus Micrarchaeota archaeon]MBU1886272.1 hypothetical protein [Candidatus Micrarchaeota archaeon]
MVELNNATDVLMATISSAVENTANNIATALPGLVFAILLFIIGWVLAVIISRIFAGLLKAIKFEIFLKEHRVDDALGTVKISNVFVKILKYYIILIFLQAAVSMIELNTLSFFMASVLVYAPVLIGAVLLALMAVIIGEYVKEILLDLGSKSPFVILVARGSKLLIIYIGITMALETIGFSTTLLNQIFVTVLQAAVYGIALAIGISFGLGGQKDAQDFVSRWRKHFRI